MARNRKKQPPKKKDVKPINITPWIPVFAIVGLALGFFVCWLTFAHLGGN